MKKCQNSIIFTHIVITDTTRGSSSEIVPTGTKVCLVNSRKEADGEWSCIVDSGVKSKCSKLSTFVVPFTVLRRITS